jgi:thiamine biosynthesis protein ThiI
MRTVIVRYGEIALKSEPVRRHFEEQLISNIQLKISKIQYELRRIRGRIFIDTQEWKKVLGPLSKTPGVVSVSAALRVNSNFDEICAKSVKVARKALHTGESFAVRTSRDGQHNYTSQQVNAAVGAAILSKVKGTNVNLSSPDRKISIEIRGPDAYIFTYVVNGVGGLPVGSQGKAAMVFRGGPNDVVAAFLILKRGCDLVLFYPDSDQKKEVGRAKLAARQLLPFHPKIELWGIPFKEVTSHVKSPREAGLYLSQAVLHGARLLANRFQAECLVVGDDADEIVSQGLRGLRLTDDACGLPVMRPLALLEKDEIKKIASEAGIKLPRKVGPLFQIKNAASNKEIAKLTGDPALGHLLQKAVDGAKKLELGE